MVEDPSQYSPLHTTDPSRRLSNHKGNPVIKIGKMGRKNEKQSRVANDKYEHDKKKLHLV